MLTITQGNQLTVTLTCKDSDGNGVDITGASLSTLIRGVAGETVTIPNDQHTINPDQVLYPGQFALELTSDDTEAFALGIHKEIITQVTIGTDIVSYRGAGQLKVLPAAPQA